MNDNRSRSHYPPRQEQQTYAYKPEGLLPTPDPTPCLDMPSSSLSSTSNTKPAITPTATTSSGYVNPNWRQDVRVDDQVIEGIFQSLPTPVDVHQPCHSHKDVRAAVGERAFSALNRQLRPAFAHSRQALVVTLFMDWQKRMSNLNMQALYRRQHEFRETRGRRRELNLQTLARRHNIGVTALGMALVGGLFSKYFCLTPHHLDPTAKTELFHIVEDEAFLRLMVHNRKRIALVLQARECLRNAAVDSDDDENDEDGLEQNRNDDDDADDGNVDNNDAGSTFNGDNDDDDDNDDTTGTSTDTSTDTDRTAALPEFTEEEWLAMVAADKELELIALEGALCVKGKRYYSKTDEANRRFWFEQVTHRSKTDKISAYTYRDAQTKPRQATHAEVQLTADLAAMGVPRSAYLVEAEMKKTHETNVATPDIKFHSPTTINGACVQWIDVKSGLTFPRTSCPRLLHDFGRKLRKYVDMHGAGIVLMHQVPLSTQLEQWALRVLGEERAAKVTFWTRIRQHTTTTTVSSSRGWGGKHKRGSGGSRGSGDSKGSGGSRSDEHRHHHHHRQQRQQRQQRTYEQDGETATNMGRLLQRHGERELSSFMNSNYQDYQDDHSVSSSGSNTRDSSVDSSASSLHMLGDGYGYGYDANCGNTRAYANTPVTTSAPASPETRRRNSGVSRPNGRQPHHPHPNARWGHGGDQKHLHRRRRRHTRSVSTPPGLDGLTTTRSTEGTQDQEEQRQTEVYVPPHRRRTRH